MFSELCRETLRKAAVCYSAGRTGSPSSSPPSTSPSTSPPPSPAKEAKTTVNIELVDVNCANNHVGESPSNTARLMQHAHQGPTIITSQDSKEIPFKKLHVEHVEKRTTLLTNVKKKLKIRRRGNCYYSVPDDVREYKSLSCNRVHMYNEQNQNIYYEYRREYGKQRKNSSGSSTDPDDSSTSGDEAGTAPEESNQRSSSAHNRHSLTKEQTLHWFANIGNNINLHQHGDSKRRSFYDEDSLDGDDLHEKQGRESTGSLKDIDRAKLVRERQNEERQRKLEELKQQALAAQRFREQRDEERRRRIEELRLKDNDRRSQVEERKRLIWEAERERREAILRKNQEREARIEAKKKNERSHIVFAFGSSTPRMLEPADTGGSSFWGTRRATSTTNVMMFPNAQPLTRRSSERELDGSKKRATSAGGLDRKPGEDMRMSSSMYEVFNWNSSPDSCLTYAKNKRASLSLPPTTDIFAIHKSDNDTKRTTMPRAASGEESDGTPGTPNINLLRVNRRRTDLIPTIPSPRDGPQMTSRILNSKAFTRSPGIRSGEVTPSSPSRPHSSMSQQSNSSVASSNVNLRSRTSTPRRPRPASIAGTGVTATERYNMSAEAKIKDSKPPLPKVHTTPKKPSSASSRSGSAEKEMKKPSDKLIKSARASPRITPKATPLQSPSVEQPPLIRQDTTEIIKNNNKESQEPTVIKTDDKQDEKKDLGNEKNTIDIETNNSKSEVISHSTDNRSISLQKSVKEESSVITKEEKKDENEKKLSISSEVKGADEDTEEAVDMSASMIAKIRITTEEEAKAALAERRRLAREQAEREAELERQRLVEEARLEAERLKAEEEEQRRLEEETLRLANEAKEAEEQRLRLAIEDAKRREEEDRKRREEEVRQKLEKEEADRKAREEAERQRLEMAERLKKEEEERIARRKRVEAIMKRTRGGNNQSNTPSKGDGDKSKEESPSEENKPMASNKVDDVMTTSLISEATQQFINSEKEDNHNTANNSSTTDIMRNGTHSNGINQNSKTIIENNSSQDNGDEFSSHHANNQNNHKNGITNQITLDNATVKQNNMTNNLLDISECDTLNNSSRGPIYDLSSNFSNEDTLNSNLNPAAMPFTPMVNPFMNVTGNSNSNPFHDAFTANKNQENNPVPDLLS
ncbi:protein split ends isoform X5 [Chelonus insularis]|uniref:protein split ends isoform X5 n=1 Tax=Chelonus insularis TaxID=460826 RepID=UPI001588ABE6|nr:protein split ends-like isoform X5 [Chelonus insularis]